MEAAKRLKPERLAEPISPAEHRRTEGGSVRNRKISRPEHRSSSKSWFGAASEGERSEPEGRAFWSKEYCVLFVENKPTGTPGCFEKTFRCGERGERSSPRPPKAAKRLEVERFGAKSTAYSLWKKSRPEHRDVLKKHSGAKKAHSVPRRGNPHLPPYASQRRRAAATVRTAASASRAASSARAGSKGSIM